MKTNKITTEARRGISLILVFGMIFSGTALPTAFGNNDFASYALCAQAEGSTGPCGGPIVHEKPAVDLVDPGSLDPGSGTVTGDVTLKPPPLNGTESLFRNDYDPLSTATGCSHPDPVSGCSDFKPELISPPYVSHPGATITPEIASWCSHPDPISGCSNFKPELIGHGIKVLPDKGSGEIIDVNPKPEQVGQNPEQLISPTWCSHPDPISGCSNELISPPHVSHPGATITMVSEVVVSSEKKETKADSESIKDKRKRLLDRHLLMKKIENQKSNDVKNSSSEDEAASKVLSRPRNRPTVDRTTPRHGASVHVSVTRT